MSQSYEVPELTRAEVRSVRDSNSRPVDCPQCKNGTRIDPWPSPAGCNSSCRDSDARSGCSAATAPVTAVSDPEGNLSARNVEASRLNRERPPKNRSGACAIVQK